MKYLNIKIGWINISLIPPPHNPDITEKIKTILPFHESNKREKFIIQIVSSCPKWGYEIKINKFSSLYIKGNKAKLFWRSLKLFPTIYTALYIFSQYAHLRNNAFLIHSAGLHVGNNGYLFAGHSGAGKTTIARKIPPSDLLNDEAVAVKCGRGLFLKETPFGTNYSYRTTSPILKSIIFIHQSTHFSIKKINYPFSVPTLLAHLQFIGKLPQKLRNKAFLLSARVARKVPVYIAHLPLNITVNKIINMVSE